MILSTVRHWSCPNCGLKDQTADPRLTNRFHTCPKLHGLTAPLVLEGTKAKVEAVERGDYVGSEQVQTDENGRPVMAVKTTRDDGQDVAVFAPTAIAQT